ncbi:MAG TPA: signal peptide peptidase SppA [Bacteroidales bacterium]|nr:signal peptide peptidase SppA [Bacteroidales bacterium]HOH23199.1 signal peptide peptidase SppA [Bacteroidales bacterium]HPZ04297.1 signal peptide peptidase SppA [Bacteroidales bacterium]HQB75904.1 signal peptide peptidase SppA [Bacteroidales bacterium]
MNYYNNQRIPAPESGSRKFWRIVFGSMLGFLISSIVMFVLSIIFMIGIIANIATTSTPTVPSNAILRIELSGLIAERGEKNPFEDTGFAEFTKANLGLDDILKSIDKAATDPKIKAISLEGGVANTGLASVQEIYTALERFKESGKKVYAYGDYYSQKGYFLASVADEIHLNPLGMIDFKGIAMRTVFFKGLLDKMEIDVQIIRHGTFKSAVEPFMLDKMSEANAEQLSLIANQLWSVITEKIAEKRDISTDSLNQIANKLLCFEADQCQSLGMIDHLSYYSGYEDNLRTFLELEKDKKINYITLNEYKKQVIAGEKAGDNIAVIYAFGDIVDGEGSGQNIGSKSLCKEIRKAYTRDDVKAIVFRVNSPGGSAMASGAIWNEIELAKKAGKIVVTSMGDYAASGGYYISCNSDWIVAQPSTLTGSIGVFGIVASIQKMMKNKLGITYDVVKSNEYADFATGRLMDPYELNILQNSVETVYSLFTQRVAQGRGLEQSYVDEIGEGRVWSGIAAIENKLVDQLGNIDDAIAKAAELAELTDYGIVEYPAPVNIFEKFFKQGSQTEVEMLLKQRFGELYFTFDAMRSVTEMDGVQARIPMSITID